MVGRIGPAGRSLPTPGTRHRLSENNLRNIRITTVVEVLLNLKQGLSQTTPETTSQLQLLIDQISAELEDLVR